MKIHPDVELENGRNGLAFRLGLIASDVDGGIWGLTARHVFDKSPSDIKTRDGRRLSTYRAEENSIEFSPGDVSNQIVRFQIGGEFVKDARNVRLDTTWPRTTVEHGTLLGATVVSPDSLTKVIGAITEVQGIAKVELSESSRPQTLHGTAVLSLEHGFELGPGSGGALVLSEAGEVIGLGIAELRSDDLTQIIVCPIEPYLRRHNYRLWVPPGSSWSDLPQRVSLFLKSVELDTAPPDLGGIPGSRPR